MVNGNIAFGFWLEDQGICVQGIQVELSFLILIFMVPSAKRQGDIVMVMELTVFGITGS